MNLFRLHKKFEDQLQEQLGDMEYKPSTSLWDRIDADITKDGFETGVKNNLENFEQVPYSDTWEKIAAELPAEKNPNTRLKYYGLGALAFLFTIGLWVGSEWNKQELPLAVVETYTVKQPQTESVSITSASNSKITATNTTNRVAPQTETTTPKAPKPLLATSQNRDSRQLMKLNTSKANQSIGSPKVKDRNSDFWDNTLPQVHSVSNKAIISEQPIVNKGSVASEIEPIDLPMVTAKNDVREVTPAVEKQDTANVSVTYSTNTKSDEGLTKFSISILAGAHLCLMDYATPSNPQFNFGENIALRKNLERADVDWSGGFLLDYRISKKWMISSGLMMTNFTQQFDYNTVAATNPINPNETLGPVYTMDSVITGNGYTNRIKYSWTEIPLMINYNVRKGERWDLDVQAGASYAIINGVDAGMVSYDNKGVFALKDKNAFPQIKNSVFVSLMPQVSYRFGDNVSVGFVPTFKYSVASMIGNDRWVQQHPYFVGLNICLRKRF
jgi:hypothetical protein